MSDQDFFFDDEEQSAPQDKPAPQKQTAKPAASAAEAPSASSLSNIELTWTIVGLVAVVSLLLGVIVGYMIPSGSSPTSASGTASGQQTAPQLTQEQMQSGQLPPGHPNIGATTGSQATSPSKAATKTK